MPKRFMIALLVIAVAVAACHGSSNPNPVPTAVPSGSPTPNPHIHKATVKVIKGNNTPAPGIPVSISTPASATSPRPGTPFETKTSGMKGLAVFKMLKPNKTYCWVAKFGSGVTSSFCAGYILWQNENIVLGN